MLYTQLVASLRRVWSQLDGSDYRTLDAVSPRLAFVLVLTIASMLFMRTG